MLFYIWGEVMGDNISEAFGERIKKARKAKKMSQTDLAEAVGYKDKSMVSKIEKGKIDVPVSKVFDIADALGADPFYLLLAKDAPELMTTNISVKTEVDKEEFEKLHRFYHAYLLADDKTKSVIDMLLDYKENIDK